MCAGSEPRRKWNSFSPMGTLKTRMTVPFSEAVASMVPALLMLRLPSVL